jgi:APA family basic amino acid/polyamine antiporter
MARLTRTIGVRGLTAGLFNTTVGAGIFLIPALVAQLLGDGAVYAYLTCAVAMLGIVLAIAAAASRVPRAGGTYAFAEAAFGPFIGTLAGVMVWLSDLLASSAVAASLAGAIAVMAPPLGTPVGRAALLAILLGGLAYVNVRGVRHGTRLVEVITIGKLLPLVVLIVACVVVRGPGGWDVGPVPDAAALGRAALVLIFAFAGVESAMSLGEEVTDPARTIPRALVAALALVTGLYVAVHLSASAALGAALPRTVDATLATAAGVLLGPPGRALLAIGTVISMFGYVSALVLATPRLVFAMARRGLLPAPLAAIHPERQTPAMAIIAHTTLLFGVAVSGSFTALAGFASVAVMSVYLLACVSALHLQRTNTTPDPVDAGGSSFRVPTVVLVLAALVCAVLLTQARPAELALEAGVLAAAAAWYLVRRSRLRPDREALLDRALL